MDDIYYIVAHRDQVEIDSFKSRYDAFDTQVIAKIFSSLLHEKVLRFEQSKSWGTSHVVYFVWTKDRKKPYVLRANLGVNKIPEYVMKTEKMITDLVRKTGVPTNTVLHVDISRDTFPFDFQIQECLDGADVEHHFSGTKEEYDNISYTLGKYIAMYSKISFEKFGLFDEKNAGLSGTKKSMYGYLTVKLDNDIEYLEKAGIITQDTSGKIPEIFYDHKKIVNSDARGHLVHHDLADHNIFFKGNTITGIFDWETAVSADPVLDLASAPTWRTHFPREQKIIEGYLSVAGILPENFSEKMNIYRLRTMLWKMVFAIRMGIVNNTRVAKFNDALKPFGLV